MHRTAGFTLTYKDASCVTYACFQETSIVGPLSTGPGKTGEGSWSLQGLSGAEWDGECHGPKQTHPGRESVKAGTNFMASASRSYKFGTWAGRFLVG